MHSGYTVSGITCVSWSPFLHSLCLPHPTPKAGFTSMEERNSTQALARFCPLKVSIPSWLGGNRPKNIQTQNGSISDTRGGGGMRPVPWPLQEPGGSTQDCMSPATAQAAQMQHLPGGWQVLRTVKLSSKHLAVLANGTGSRVAIFCPASQRSS